MSITTELPRDLEPIESLHPPTILTYGHIPLHPLKRPEWNNQVLTPLGPMYINADPEEKHFMAQYFKAFGAVLTSRVEKAVHVIHPVSRFVRLGDGSGMGGEITAEWVWAMIDTGKVEGQDGYRNWNLGGSDDGFESESEGDRTERRVLGRSVERTLGGRGILKRNRDEGHVGAQSKAAVFDEASSTRKRVSFGLSDQGSDDAGGAAGPQADSDMDIDPDQIVDTVFITDNNTTPGEIPGFHDVDDFAGPSLSSTAPTMSEPARPLPSAIPTLNNTTQPVSWRRSIASAFTFSATNIVEPPRMAKPPKGAIPSFRKISTISTEQSYNQPMMITVSSASSKLTSTPTSPLTTLPLNSTNNPSPPATSATTRSTTTQIFPESPTLIDPNAPVPVRASPFDKRNAIARARADTDCEYLAGELYAWEKRRLTGKEFLGKTAFLRSLSEAVSDA